MTSRRRNGMALVAALAAAFSVAAFPQAASATPIVSILSNTCLQPYIPTNPDRIPSSYQVFVANCGPETNSGPQHWVWGLVGTSSIRGKQGQFNVYRFLNGATGACLSNRGRLEDAALIFAEPCSGTSAGQKWTFGRSGPLRSVEMINAASGKCLDVYGGFLGPNIQMIQWPCPSTPFEGNLFLLP